MNGNITETMDNDRLDQTRFAEEAVILPNLPGKKPEAEPRRRPSPLLLLLVVVPVAFGLFVVSLLMRGQSNRQAVTASPTPVPEEGTPSEIESRFAQLASDIQSADPTTFSLAFPPVDFALGLEDATELQSRSRR
jgi:hypothetical protein